MPTPIPKSKPASSGMAGIVAVLIVLLLVGGEYYFLTTKDGLKNAPAKTEANAKKVLPSEKVKTPGAVKVGKKIGKHDEKELAKSGPTPPMKEATAPLDVAAMFAGKGGGPSFIEETMAKVDAWETQGAGLGVRGILIAAAIALMFMQKPPEPKVGAQRRYARNPKTIVVPMQVIAVLFIFSAVIFLGIGYATGGVLTYGYPVAAVVCLGCGFMGGFLRASTIPVEGRLMAESVRRDTQYGIVLGAEGGKYVNIPNPFRGTLVLGGAGAGKTYSIGEPFLEQFLQRGMCGIIYDFKFPVLAAAAQKALLYSQPYHTKLIEQYEANKKANKRNKDGIIEGLRKPIRHRVINFVDMERTEKVNPLRPQDMPTTAYAMEYAQTILTNLSPGGAKSGDNFFTKSAQAYLTGIIWYYRNNYPALCTIPHVVATAVYKDFTFVLHMLSQDPSCEVLVQSLITAVRQGAEKQIAGVVSSLQVDMASLATAEISWVLSPDEDPRLGEETEGFSLNLNDPNNPTLLTIGNDPTLARTFSPVISCVIAVALKLMNQQYKHPSFVLIDEGATIYVPGLEVIPATARSNRVAMLYMTQDMAQLIDAYGKDKAQVLVSNLNNQFFGKINSAETAKLVSDMIGREDVEMVSINTGQSMGGTGSSSKGQSVSVQERQVFRVQDAYTLRQGEFVGQTVETPQSFFMAMMEREVEVGDYPIAPFTFFEAERGVVSGTIRKELAKSVSLDKSNLVQMGPVRRKEEVSRTTIEKTALKEELASLGKPRRGRGKKLNLELLEGGPSVTDTINKESTDNKASNLYKDKLEAKEDKIDNQDNPSEGSNLDQGEGEDSDWGWAFDTPTPTLATAAQWAPTLAEQEQLDAAAAHARRERERTKYQPNAAAQVEPPVEEDPIPPELSDEEQSAIRAKFAAERETERRTKLTQVKTGTNLEQMIIANYKRITADVEKAIDNSKPNSLSKEGLAAKATTDKAEAAARQRKRDLEASGDDAPYAG